MLLEHLKMMVYCMLKFVKSGCQRVCSLRYRSSTIATFVVCGGGSTTVITYYTHSK